MAGRFDFLSDAVPGRTAWRFKVRISRIWNVSGFLRNDQVNSVEMVLVDSKGGRIHATVRKQLLYLFQRKFEEGLVYVMSFFTVAPSSGAYRSTLHPYKLVFQMKTRVELCEGPEISRYGLSLTSIAAVLSHPPEYDYLVDVIGLLTGLSPEREYIRDSKVTKMIVIELTDHTGKLECALFGDHVQQFQTMVGKSSESVPVIVVQFAKVKIFRDNVSIQNVLNATRVLVEPDIAEVSSFRDGLAVHGVGVTSDVAVLGPRVRPSVEEDFLHTYPVKSVSELNSLLDDGTFVVAATILGVVPGADWWYPACKCHKSISPDSGSYYCGRCVRHVFQMIPRFRVKLLVTDGISSAVFVVFDSDMECLLGSRCSVLVASAVANTPGSYPPEIIALEGSTVLFKVARVTTPDILTDGSFRVKRVCTDPAILKCFQTTGTCSVSAELADDVPVLVSDDHLSGGLPSLSEAGVDGLVLDLVSTPDRSSVDLVGLSDSVSINKTPEHSSASAPGDCGDPDDITPISVLLPNLRSRSSTSAKRSLDNTFGELGDILSLTPLKTAKMD